MARNKRKNKRGPAPASRDWWEESRGDYGDYDGYYDDYGDYSTQYPEATGGAESDWNGWYDHGYTPAKQTKRHQGRGRGRGRGRGGGRGGRGAGQRRYSRDDRDQWRDDYYGEWDRHRDYAAEDYRDYGYEEDTRREPSASRTRSRSREREDYRDASRGREREISPSRDRFRSRSRGGRDEEPYTSPERERDSRRDRQDSGSWSRRRSQGERVEEERYTRYQDYGRMEPPVPPSSGAPPPHPGIARSSSASGYRQSAQSHVPRYGSHGEPLQGPSPLSSIHSSPAPLIEPPAPPPPPPPPPPVQPGPAHAYPNEELGHNGSRYSGSNGSLRSYSRIDSEERPPRYSPGSPSATHESAAINREGCARRRDFSRDAEDSQPSKRQRVRGSDEASPREANDGPVSNDRSQLEPETAARGARDQFDVSPGSVISGTDSLEGSTRTITYTNVITFKVAFRFVGRADVEPVMPEPARIESRADLDKKKRWWPPRKTRAYMALEPAEDEDREAYKKCVKDLMKRNRVSRFIRHGFSRAIS
eukprot:gb/GECG01007217.1/.p1 GENE.gb/GECG01007217.1/~~gb/GECG01007217.1/.p1  ORF type:complete len:533 (+),score=47.51 gb/GECG01007217.1/:1-1599(+)